MKNCVINHYPLILSAVLFAIIISITLLVSVIQNHGHFIYALDDPYIHMSMAKNFVNRGVWGIDGTGFTSSSSSPLWTLIIALSYYIFGVNELSPLILNIVFSFLLLVSVYLLLKKFPPRAVFCVLVSLILFMPLPSLIFTGQEHILHAVLSILFVFFSTKALMENKIVMLVLPLSSLTVFARYEGIFIVFIVCLLFALRKRFLDAFYIFAAGFFPITVYGIISLINGWNFFPNSVLIKGNAVEFSISETSRLINRLVNQSVIAPHITLLFVSAFLLVLSGHKKKEIFLTNSKLLIVIFLTVSFLHLMFARVGWFFRYEAYLVALGLFSIFTEIIQYPSELRFLNFKSGYRKKSNFICLIVFALMIASLVWRGGKALLITPRATTNIFEQQYQMGLFVREYYKGESIALNDIGAVNFLADIKCFDIWGLSNYEVLIMRRKEIYCTDEIDRMTYKNNCKIAIVYDDWLEFYGGVPSRWIKVGEWKIYNNVVAARDRISFYAFDSLGAVELKKNLMSYSVMLPKSVKKDILDI